MTEPDGRNPSVAIVGAGMSGICIGSMLKRAGMERFTIFEQAEELGGTWRDNRYPGLTCDVPSRLYQYSFAPNPGWTRLFSPGEEIRRYLSAVADRHGLGAHLRFGAKVVAARFERPRWRLELAGGEEVVTDFVVTACGFLRQPRLPAIDGLETFSGAAFHSSQWDARVAVRGCRVGVVGNGSTGVQIVTALAGVPQKLLLFQRTPQWVFPLPNRRYTAFARSCHGRMPAFGRFAYRAWRAAFESFTRPLTEPGLQRHLMAWMCRSHLRTVRDPVLRQRLTPADPPMCKRLIVSSGFYRAVQRDDVEVVTDPIVRAEPEGLVTRSRCFPVDVLVFATGFDAHAYMRPLRVMGEGGVALDDVWREGNRAYRTVAVPGFPNLFVLMGPHSPVANQAATAVAETQARYVLRWIQRWQAGGFDAVAPTAAATECFNRALDAAMGETTWASGCNSWYLDDAGRPEVWPWRPRVHRELLSEMPAADFEVVR